MALEQAEKEEIYLSEVISSTTYPKLATNVNCSKYGKVATINLYGFKNLSNGENANIFKVPAGYEPANSFFSFCCPGGSFKMYRINISPTGYGSVYVYNDASLQSNITESLTYITK